MFCFRPTSATRGTSHTLASRVASSRFSTTIAGRPKAVLAFVAIGSSVCSRLNVRDLEAGSNGGGSVTCSLYDLEWLVVVPPLNVRDLEAGSNGGGSATCSLYDLEWLVVVPPVCSMYRYYSTVSSSLPFASQVRGRGGRL